MHSFEVHSNESACRKVDVLGWTKSMDRSEYIKIKIIDTPTEFIDKYNLQEVPHNGWLYFEMFIGCYGLPQSGKLANDLLRTRLNKAVYDEAATTPGLWKQNWLPIQF